MTLGDSGYCLGGCNAKSIDKHSLGIILIGWFLFSQWLPISDVCRVSVGCLEDVWKCLEGVQGCLITLQGVTMLFQPINMDRESCYSSSCFSPSAIFSARKGKKTKSVFEGWRFFMEARGLGPFLNKPYGSMKEVLGVFFVIF